MTTALVSATVAFVILIITQCVIFWRERSRLLLGKLEELYVLLLDLGERNLTRFEPLMGLLAGQRIKQSALSSAEVVAALSKRTDLSFDHVMAGDLLERVSLLVNFYFPQLRPELDQMFEANRWCIGILHGITETGFVGYQQVQEIATTFADRKAAMEKRILAERKALTKTFTGKFRTRFERLRSALRKSAEKTVQPRMDMEE